jgi:hypothetical protein
MTVTVKHLRDVNNPIPDRPGKKLMTVIVIIIERYK